MSGRGGEGGRQGAGIGAGGRRSGHQSPRLVSSGSGRQGAASRWAIAC